MTTTKSPTAVQEVKPTVYRQYLSGIMAHRIITDASCGNLSVNISGGRYITDDKAIIKFLDAQIELGHLNLTKADDIMSDEINPMDALRKKIIAEYEADKKAAATAAVKASTIPTAGDADAESTSAPVKLNPQATAALAALNAKSNSKS